jgi:hypothetical protein
MILSIFKALPTVEPVEDLTVSIVEPIPELPKSSYPGWTNLCAQRFEQQGQALADALVHHLPGGTVDQLLHALLQHRASLFHVINVPEGGAAIEHAEKAEVSA